MSAIASLTLLDRSGVPELARLAQTSPSALHTYLAEHGRKPPEEYDWSGYCMLYVLTYLDERDIDLERSEFHPESAAINGSYGMSLLIPPADQELLDRLDPAGHSTKELAAHFAEMEFDSSEESVMAGLDGLRLLRDTISQLRENEVLLLQIV